MVAMETVTNQYLGGDTSMSCSLETQTEIDSLVVELVKKEHEKALKLLTENRDKLESLSRHLYEKETITGDEFMELLNQSICCSASIKNFSPCCSNAYAPSPARAGSRSMTPISSTRTWGRRIGLPSGPKPPTAAGSTLLP